MSVVAMTAKWKMVLWKIDDNKADADAFYRDKEVYAISITRKLMESNIAEEM